MITKLWVKLNSVGQKLIPALKVLLNDTEDFADKVMCQHYIISYGDNTALIKDFCKIVGIEII